MMIAYSVQTASRFFHLVQPFWFPKCVSCKVSDVINTLPITLGIETIQDFRLIINVLRSFL